MLEVASYIKVVQSHSICTLQIEVVEYEILRRQLKLHLLESIVEEEGSVTLLGALGAQYFARHFALGWVFPLLLAVERSVHSEYGRELVEIPG